MAQIFLDSLFWVRHAEPDWIWIPFAMQVYPCADNLTLVSQVNRVLVRDLDLFAFAERRLAAHITGFSDYCLLYRGM
jgi:hypothetical protein